MISSWQQLSESTTDKSCKPDDVVAHQEKWLIDCLRQSRRTEFGQQYCFGEIHSIDDYRSSVPLHNYEDFAGLIKKVEQGEGNILFSGKAIAFEKTSGSRDAPKLIPYSSQSLLDFRRAILPWLSDLARQYQISEGCAYWAISPATRPAEVTSGGVPIGLPDAAYLGEDIIPFFQNVSSVPHWVGELDNIQDWQLTTLYFLVSSHDLVLISVWSPTFLLTLLDALHDRQAELLNVLTHGMELNGHFLKADVLAAQRLDTYYQMKDARILWPALKVISCWADASSTPFYNEIITRFPDVVVQPKGLLLTEGVVTVPSRDNLPVLAVNSGFYEFLDEHDNSWLAHELVKGQTYEVVMTTSAGLYRYRTYDKVRCDGYEDGLPVLRFTGRGNLTSDLVGEKLTDEFVQSCLSDITGFRMLIPTDNTLLGYLLVLDKQQKQDQDSLVRMVEQRLSANPQYAYARKLGQLSPLKPLLLDNPLKIYLTSQEHAETRLGDIKVPALCTRPAVFGKKIGVAA